MIPPNPPSERGRPPPGPTPSTASGAVGASGRAGRASRAQPPPYANPGYATGCGTAEHLVWSIAEIISKAECYWLWSLFILPLLNCV
jgi:hypothetical protein